MSSGKIDPQFLKLFISHGATWYSVLPSQGLQSYLHPKGFSQNQACARCLTSSHHYGVMCLLIESFGNIIVDVDTPLHIAIILILTANQGIANQVFWRK